MAESLLTYKGNCHCGINRYEVQLPELPSLVVCNCTLCMKKGHIWIYEADSSLKTTRGCTADTLTTYKSSYPEGLEHEIYVLKDVDFWFCSTCGTGLFGTHASGAQAKKKGINFRVLVSDTKEIFIKGREVIAFDASGNTKPYPGFLSIVENDSSPPSAELPESVPSVPGENLKHYTGGCDCGAVRIAVTTKPLFDVEIKEDNCSICSRNGFIGVYPHQSEVTLDGKDQTRDYKFGRGFNGSPFCRTCGVHCFGNLYGPPKEVIARLPEAKQEFVRKQLETQPLNIRVLDGVEWDRINIKWSNDGTAGYELPE
ncbi:glutathione-dependent formaldehyde-activating enzyme [Colletotrichum zoysiae]|uniref:Glutathione-dependent formaldehyde-activating enzyme n=1 Tax=Colletotrichum zoysiae TaxID=1216348 RepID=A0AAD9HL44_9PEZI|nr:glutathione-dependent formaldehyde-activating enzyme [Colletotrichum zoysiae]